MKKLNAFTLAEVLITLGIIGVVAAMTLPTLIQNHQKQVYATQLKKSINVFQNMLNQMKVNEGVTELDQVELFSKGVCHGWDCDGFDGSNYVDFPVVQETIAKYLKTAKICKVGECSISYKTGTYTTKDNKTLSCGYGYGEGKRLGEIGFYSTDGAIYYVGSGGFNDLTILIDVNGEKGPNMFGRDLFNFFVWSYEQKFGTNDDCAKRLLENNFTMDY